MSLGDKVIKRKEEPLRTITLRNGDQVREYKTYCLLNGTERMLKEYLSIRIQADAEAEDRVETPEQQLAAARLEIKALKKQVYELHAEIRRLMQR